MPGGSGGEGERGLIWEGLGGERQGGRKRVSMGGVGGRVVGREKEG